MGKRNNRKQWNMKDGRRRQTLQNSAIYILKYNYKTHFFGVKEVSNQNLTGDITISAVYNIIYISSMVRFRNFVINNMAVGRNFLYSSP
jgi:hypothetical protein